MHVSRLKPRYILIERLLANLRTIVRFYSNNLKVFLPTHKQLCKLACTCCKINNTGSLHTMYLKVLEETSHGFRRVGGSVLVIRKGILEAFGRS